MLRRAWIKVFFLGCIVGVPYDVFVSFDAETDIKLSIIIIIDLKLDFVYFFILGVRLNKFLLKIFMGLLLITFSANEQMKVDKEATCGLSRRHRRGQQAGPARPSGTTA